MLGFENILKLSLYLPILRMNSPKLVVEIPIEEILIKMETDIRKTKNIYKSRRRSIPYNRTIDLMKLMGTKQNQLENYY